MRMEVSPRFEETTTGGSVKSFTSNSVNEPDISLDDIDDSSTAESEEDEGCSDGSDY